MQSLFVEKWNEKQVHSWLSHLDECETCGDNLQFLMTTCNINEDNSTNNSNHSNNYEGDESIIIPNDITLTSFKDMVPFFKYHSILGIDLLDISIQELHSMFFYNEEEDENSSEEVVPSCNLKDELTNVLIHKLYYHICILKFNNENVNNNSTHFQYCNDCNNSRVHSRIH